MLEGSQERVGERLKFLEHIVSNSLSFENAANKGRNISKGYCWKTKECCVVSCRKFNNTVS